MGWIILIIFIGAPILELSVLIDVGGEIGGLSTIILCIATAAIGLSIVRSQGLQVMQRMQTAMAEGQPFGDQMIHGFFLLVAGLMLMFPGFISDGIGALLLIPPFRSLLGAMGLARIIVSRRPNFNAQGFASHEHPERDETIVDIDGVEIEEAIIKIESNTQEDDNINTNHK